MQAIFWNIDEYYDFVKYILRLSKVVGLDHGMQQP